ncbi:MAG: phosphodiester glycosidase family protein, partial [Oscillospiraceae bacterium]|nr:phosphodiester glycosidase family protein [Oscillospiraceae bacterium]
AKLKVSYSKYFTEGSSKATRTAAVNDLSYSFTRPTVQAAAYEKATSRNVIFAMNGNFAFDNGEPMGLIKVEGNVIHPSDSNAKIYFAILKDGSYAFRTYTDDHSDVVEAVAGRQWLVRDGKQVKQNTEQISARTAIGLKADGTLVTFVVNGKTNSYGVTINDMSELMFSLGCVNAINLDGGGSSLFATQRGGNSDLVIRNSPSDADGERKVSSALFLVTEPQTDRLYFDFTNDVAAKARYKADVYGGLNYDTGNWHYHHTYCTVPAFDNTAGTMSFSTTSACPTDRHIHPVITSANTSYTGGHPLVYIPSGEDYFKVRMKIEGSTDSAANFRMMYANDDGAESTAIAWSGALPTGWVNGDYFTIEGNLNFREVDAVTAIRPEVYNLTVEDPTENTVKFTYDYIYVGPKSGAVTGEALLFDFTNSRAARERYATIPYGFMDFDRSTEGFWATAYNSSGSAFSIDNAEGLLHVEVTEGFSGTADAGNLTYGPWIKTTNSSGCLTGRTTYAYYPLSYIPENADVLQVRFKAENCVIPEGKTPNLVLEYYYTLDDVHAYKNDIRKTYSLTNGAFQTLTVPVSSAFRAADVIKCFGLRFQNIKGKAVGDIAIDYIYVGPSCTAPDPVHTWDSGAVTARPTCAEDGVRTYTCTKCTTTMTEVIEHTGHSYTYTPMDGNTHTVGCESCELSETAPHSYENGACICGEKEVTEPVEDMTLKLNHSLNLASDISVNLVVPKTLLAGFDMETVYVESTLETYEGNERTGTKTLRIFPVESESYYYFTLDGLTAVQMNDTISSVLYGTKDGRPYYSPVDEYSIATYAYSQLNSATRPEALKRLCADLLRYGSKAQIYKS